MCHALVHCAASSRIDPPEDVAAISQLVADAPPVPQGGDVDRGGSPHVVAGPKSEFELHYRAEGLASWYGNDFHGRYTADGEIFDRDGISAAHPMLPLPSYARVTNLSNGKSLIVRVNDRGPYHGHRIIDVSARVAHLLGFRERGTAWVRVEYVGRAPLSGSDERTLEATLRDDEPAPLPGSLKRMATLADPTRHTRVASAVASDPPPPPMTAAASTGSNADPPTGLDGTDQFLNGRGLY
ncbi:MAG TPA: septal ring lytic transglycosylase RlpA family protein [Xanthobacteraceae bacterium]